MTKPAAIQGNYSDIKNVKTRSCVQIIIEVPIEHAAQIQAVLGWPQPGSEIPVAIARLHDGVADKPSSTEPTSEQSAAPSPRTIDDMSYPQQAALLCKSEPFQTWLERRYPTIGAIGDTVEQYAASSVRIICDISSRSELADNSIAAGKWQQLYSAYKSERPF